MPLASGVVRTGVEPDSHADGRLLTIGCRHRRDHVRRNLPVGVRIEHGVDLLIAGGRG